MASGKRSGRGFLLGAVLAVLAILACFVPVRTCETCHGIAGFRIGDAVDLRCRDCGGKGKQTVLDIVIAKIRS